MLPNSTASSLVTSSPLSVLDPSSPALRRLIREHLLERSDGMPPASLAAFIAGWSSALELLRRSDAIRPWVTPELHRWVGTLLDAIEAASAAELADED